MPSPVGPTRDPSPWAIVGGGPAGAHLAARLAASGRPVTVFDEKLAWEKPCGGGVTDKAVREFPFLADALAPRNWVSECDLISPAGRCVRLQLDRPVAIFARQVLNGLLLRRAAAAGAAVVQDRVVRLAPAPDGWRLDLKSGASTRAPAVLLAAGARNPFRAQFPTSLTSADWMATAGYYIDQSRLPWPPHRMLIRFLPGLAGYIWSFPRSDHASVGICGSFSDGPVAALRRRLEDFLTSSGIAWQGSPFYAHLLPAPSARALDALVLGDVAPAPWALAGDAAGLADPITGEGLYYALRSADLLADCLLRHPLPAALSAYAAAMRQHLLPELRAAAAIADRFYHGQFLGQPVLERMTQFSRRSRRFRQLLCDLFSGAQGYTGLRRRLYRNLVPTLLELTYGN